MKIDNFFHKAEKAEKEFLNSEFISPIIRGSKVRVRILGLVYELKIQDNYEGWAILKPVSPTSARVAGTPSLLQIHDYLAKLSKIRLILCEKRKNSWYGINQQMWGIESQIFLIEGIELFDSILARYDGLNYWFEGKDRSADPTLSEYLRTSLHKNTLPDNLNKSGLTPFHQEAYKWQIFLKEKKITELTLEKLKDAVGHGGGKLHSYIEHGNSLVVRFFLDGEDYRATVQKKNLEVISGGICLSGEDEKFDLQSLMGVIKEGRERDKIYRTDREE